MAQIGNDNRSKWNPSFCKQLIEHMAAGCSYATFGAVIGVRYSTMKRWEKSYPEWEEAVELGQLVLMYTWEKIIIGQANGSIKGLPATTIFALKNYFPEKFKENTALQGNGNTIVVFDSGVPTAISEKGNQPVIEAVSNNVNADVIEVTPRSRVESGMEKNSDFGVKTQNHSSLPDYLQNSITEDDI